MSMSTSDADALAQAAAAAQAAVEAEAAGVQGDEGMGEDGVVTVRSAGEFLLGSGWGSNSTVWWDVGEGWIFYWSATHTLATHVFPCAQVDIKEWVLNKVCWW